jgi:hypothetical protein
LARSSRILLRRLTGPALLWLVFIVPCYAVADLTGVSHRRRTLRSRNAEWQGVAVQHERLRKVVSSPEILPIIVARLGIPILVAVFTAILSFWM